MKKLPGRLLLFLISFSTSSVFAQTVNLGRYGAIVDSTMKEFVAEQRDLLPIYSGRLFYAYPASIEGDAFYLSKEWMPGSIRYDGVWYEDMTMMYDLVKDAVIVRHSNGVPISINNDRVSQFKIAGIQFVRLESGKGIKPGFYEVLVTGEMTLFVKRIKIIEERIVGNELERKFAAFNQYYILKDGQFTSLKKPKSLIAMLGEKKHKVNQYMNGQQVSYKKEPERAMVLITDYYNQLD